MEQSVEAMSAFPGRMYEAWIRGDADSFFADFAEDALFVELEGTVYRSRAEMIAAQTEAFDTFLEGSRLVRGEVHFARIVSPGVGVVHARMGILLPGEEEPPPVRFGMQLFVMVWRDVRWVAVALENARMLTPESTAALESLAARASTANTPSAGSMTLRPRSALPASFPPVRASRSSSPGAG